MLDIYEFKKEFGYNPLNTTINTKWYYMPFYKFYGYDWTELLLKWGMKYSNQSIDIDSESMLYIIGRLLVSVNSAYNHNYNRKSKFVKQAIKDIRYFVSGLGIDAGCYAPFWKGLSEVEEDFVFLQLFSTCFEHAWT